MASEKDGTELQGAGGTGDQAGNSCRPSALPAWLAGDEDYRPGRDRDGFLTRTLLSMVGVLERFRLDDGTASRFSPSAAVGIVFTLVAILLVSLARNFFFVLVMLAVDLARMAVLPVRKLSRVARGALEAAAISALVMAPSILLGQGQALLAVTARVFVSVAAVMCLATTTPVHDLTAALAGFHVSGLAIMTFDLALRSIHNLGRVALEVLEALRLRSVGRNRDKSSSLGGVGGVVLLKAARAARDTADAMACRGFTGAAEPPARARHALRHADAAWLAALVLLVILFCYLEAA